MGIVVTGSIANDYLMEFPGRIRDQLIDGALDHISLSFLVDDLHIYRGGIGGNISFGLGMLGYPAHVVGAVGADFAEYRNWLEAHNVDTSHVYVSRERHTARFLCTTDSDHNQIASFYAGAMAEASRIDLAAVLEKIGNVDMVVIGPDDPEAMVRHTRVCRELGVRFAADPSQQLARMAGADIRELVDGAELLFTNEYERDLLEQKTGWDRNDVVARVATWITTLGAAGLEACMQGTETVNVPAHRGIAIADPTGVGDACRSGILAGLHSGLTIRHAAEIGCTLASFVLETVGTQEYTFTPEEFVSRVANTYGAASAAAVTQFFAVRGVAARPKEYA